MSEVVNLKRGTTLPRIRSCIAIAVLGLAVMTAGCEQITKLKDDLTQGGSPTPGGGAKKPNVAGKGDGFKLPELGLNQKKKTGARRRQTRAAVWVRSNGSSNALFRKRTVTGADLLKELLALKSAVVSGSLDKGMTGLMGTSNGAESAEQKAFLSEIMSSFGELWSPNLGNTAVKAADDFFKRVIGRKKLLAQQTLELPDPKELNRLERQQVLVLASMVMGFKVSNVIMDDAVKDLEKIDEMYQNLLERRMQAAKLLLDVMIERKRAEKTQAEQIARDLKRLMTKDDLALLDGLSASQELKSFAQDLGAQNLALRYMQRKDPKAYRSYRVTADRFVSEYSALLRAAGGASAFAAFGSGFAKKAREMVEESGLIMGTLNMPFGKEIIQEGGKLSSSAVSITQSTGPWWKRLIGGGGFNVYQAGKPIAQDVSVSDVTSNLETLGAAAQFKKQMIAAKGVGYLNRVHACEPSLVGDYLDDVVPSEARLNFARTYYGLKSTAKEFTFRNAMDGAVKSRGRKAMTRDLLRRSSPKKSDAISQSIVAVHEAARNNIEKMNRKQFMRFVFANARSNPRQASVDIGEVKISLVPDRESVYVYEKYIQSCMKRFVK